MAILRRISGSLFGMAPVPVRSTAPSQNSMIYNSVFSGGVGNPGIQPVAISTVNLYSGYGKQPPTHAIAIQQNPGYSANPAGSSVGLIHSPVATSPITGEPLTGAHQTALTPYHAYTNNVRQVY